MSDEAIVTALEATRDRVENAKRERAELDRVIAASQEEAQLLERLLAIRRRSERDAPFDDYTDGMVRSAIEEQRGGKHPAVDAVIRELERASRPLHISELMSLLRDRKVTVPGAGTQANLITHLRRDERVVRPSRGIYGLTVWGLQSMAPTPRKVRRRRLCDPRDRRRKGNKHDNRA